MTDHTLTFDDVVDRLRAPLVELWPLVDEFEPAAQEFLRRMKAALDAYDEAEAH